MTNEIDYLIHVENVHLCFARKKQAIGLSAGVYMSLYMSKISGLYYYIQALNYIHYCICFTTFWEYYMRTSFSSYNINISYSLHPVNYLNSVEELLYCEWGKRKCFQTSLKCYEISSFFLGSVEVFWGKIK